MRQSATKSFQVMMAGAAMAALLCAAVLVPQIVSGSDSSYDPAANPGGMPHELRIPNRKGKPPEAIQPADISKQTEAEANAKSAGCTASSCHAGIEDMHPQGLPIGCVDCHGGDAKAKTKEAAHVHPNDPRNWTKKGEGPVRSYAMLNDESWAFVRFINPGDLRVARVTCGGNSCHVEEVKNVRHSMMATNAMLWGSALYANGVYPDKITHFGEAYTENGAAARLQTVPPPSADEMIHHGIVPYLDPLPQLDMGQPGNIVRIFEEGNDTASNRGLGTNGRVDPLFIGLQKTQLLDPNLWFLGTNDHPGDYRSSGCTACHVIYANDRDPQHSGKWAQYGNTGRSFSADHAIPKDVSGFPIKHQLTDSIPSSQCVICHMHGGTTTTNSYYGTLWYDDETDGEILYPKQDKNLTENQISEILMSQTQGSSLRGKWSDPDFLTHSSELNPQLKHQQLADFHGHGWLFRYVYRTDRHGNMLDKKGNIISDDAPDKWQRGVRLTDVHAEAGMQCADCHFERDAHGNGKLYAEVRAPLVIRCEDCHGTFNHKTNLNGSGNGALVDGKRINLRQDAFTKKTDFGPRFLVSSRLIRQQSSMERSKKWPVTQLAEVDDKHSKKYDKVASYYHTIQKDGRTWGDLKVSDSRLAHPNNDMSCQTCHSSWSSGCFGCHLPAAVNWRRPNLHYNGEMTFAWASYNAETVRPDSEMIARDGVVTGSRISPARSASGVAFTFYDANREVLVNQQQFVSFPGFSGQAFTTYVPHTVREAETKQCTDCHVSRANDNNAALAQLLMLGTNYFNFFGRFAFVGEGKGGLDAVTITERPEPQAVIGSHLHKVAYPDEYKAFAAHGDQLTDAYHHGATDCIDIQNRGEYLFTADGPGGFYVYDVANLDNKAISQRVITAPFSPLGQRTWVRTKYATSVGLPTTELIDPYRKQKPGNLEQKVPMLYAYAFVTDKYEGLVIINTIVLADGNPENNFLKRDATFNPGGILNGAMSISFAGNYAYVSCDRGIVVLDISQPTAPRVVTEVGAPYIVKPRAVGIQFRYAFVIDAQGLKVLDITFPDKPKPVSDAAVNIADARKLYVARTYAYVAAGSQGVVIVNVERPEHPVLDQVFNAGGAINDATDIKVGMANADLIGLVADGKNGLRVLQLHGPNDSGNMGFSPRPAPKLIATYRTRSPALAIAKGVDRDRAVDESGNQLAVFDRLGSRPFTLEEMQKLYLRDGELYTVSDKPE